MLVAGPPTPNVSGYQLRLPIFEGPLDVLLRLIERDQLAITDVSLVAVTEQFVAYTATLSDVPPVVLADFAATAARLLALKSRSLLPAPPVVEVEPEPDDLTRQLAAYQAAKTVAAELRRRETENLRSWPLGQSPLGELTVSERLLAAPLAALPGALRRCLARALPAPAHHQPAPVISLAAVTRRLLERLGARPARFSELLGPAASRAEQAVAFIALLALLRRRAVEARQAALFGEIDVIPYTDA